MLRCIIEDAVSTPLPNRQDSLVVSMTLDGRTLFDVPDSDRHRRLYRIVAVQMLSTRNTEITQDADDGLDELPQTQHQLGSCKQHDQEHCDHGCWERMDFFWYQALLRPFKIGLLSQMMKAEVTRVVVMN